jgi:hypothetical protein
MPSVLTALAPTLFSAAQEVSAEPFGVISAINATFDDKGVAKGDTVTVPYMPVQSNTAFAAAATAPEGTSVTAAAIAVTITKSQMNSVVLTGEQIRSLENSNGGVNKAEWVRQWAAQAMRALRNEAEADACLAVKYGASRATGTAGTTPFGSSMDALVDVRKILADNGAPLADLQFVGNTTSMANLSKLAVIQQADAAGSDAERRSGIIARQYGFQLRQSAGIVLHTKGTGGSYVINNGNIAIGSTVLTAGSGSNTMVAGDILALQSDDNRYVCNVGLAAAGDFTIGRPGLRQATVNAKTITIGNNYTPNFAFERSAVVGVIRPPLVPANPTINQMLISDGKGLTYLMLDVSQFGQRSWFMCLAWGFKVVQGEHVALLLG